MFKSILAIVTVSFFLSGCAAKVNINPFSNKVEINYNEMYLLGIMNWWEPSEPYRLQPESKYYYSVTVELIADGQPYDFKISNDKWNNHLNCGSEYAQQEVLVNVRKPLYCAGDSLNLQFTPQETANYKFLLDTSDPNSPLLTVISVN